MDKPTADSASKSKAAPSKPLSAHPLTWVIGLVRVILLIGIVPSDLSLWLRGSNIRSIFQDPTFTLHHVQEASAVRGWFFQSSFSDSYRTGNIHLPPFLLACFETILGVLMTSYLQKLVLGLLVLLADLYIAVSIEAIGKILMTQSEGDWEAKLLPHIPQVIQPPFKHIFAISSAVDGEKEAPLFLWNDLPIVAALLYFASPVVILSSSIYGCFQNLSTLALLLAIQWAWTAPITQTALALAVASYLNVHIVVFAVPIALILQQRNQHISKFVIWFLLFLFCLYGLDLLLVGDLFVAMMKATAFRSFRITRNPPSLSVLWYFGMQLFSRFQLYFTILLGGVPYLLILPLTIRLHRYPMAMIAILWILGVLFRPPGTLYALNVGLCLMLLSPRSLAHLRPLVSLIAICAIPVPVILYTVTHWLWLVTGSGEVNFVYFQCLAYNALVAILLLEFAGASLRRDKVLRVTEKQIVSSTETKVETS